MKKIMLAFLLGFVLPYLCCHSSTDDATEDPSSPDPSGMNQSPDLKDLFSCQQNSDCVDSQLCSVAGSLVDETDTPRGYCVPKTKVAFVDGDHCSSAFSDGSQTSPYCEITDGVGKFTYLLIAPKLSIMTERTYAHVVVSAGQKVTLLGNKPLDVTNPFRLGVQDVSIAGLEVVGTGSKVIAKDIVFPWDGSGLADGFHCSQGGSTQLVRVFSINNLIGIHGDIGCEEIIFEQSGATFNFTNGIKLDDETTKYQITNSIIAANNGAGVILSGNHGLFALNTVFENKGIGIECVGATNQVMVADSIVTQNSNHMDKNQLSSLCLQERVMIGNVLFNDIAQVIRISSDPKLFVAKDYPDILFDHFGTPRPIGKSSIGFHQFF